MFLEISRIIFILSFFLLSSKQTFKSLFQCVNIEKINTLGVAVILNRFVSLILSISKLFTSFFSLIGSPVNGLKILVPKNWEMSVGDSRTFDFVFKNKDKTRAVAWEASPASVAEVDE